MYLKNTVCHEEFIAHTFIYSLASRNSMPSTTETETMTVSISNEVNGKL